MAVDLEQNVVHPTAIIEDGAEIGIGNHIGPFCFITSKVKLGNNNRLEAFVTLGTPGEHKETLRNGTEGKGLIIGDRNIIREYTSIHSGVFEDTKIGNDNTIQRNVHIGHDAVVENKVTLSCNTIVAGHVRVMNGANMGLGSITHQFTVLQPYSMLGMGTIVTKTSTIEPFCIYIGSPAKLLKVNAIGIERSGLSHEEILEIIGSWEQNSQQTSTLRGTHL